MYSLSCLIFTPVSFFDEFYLLIHIVISCMHDASSGTFHAIRMCFVYRGVTRSPQFPKLRSSLLQGHPTIKFTQISLICIISKYP